jgi:hypothetical protein
LDCFFFLAALARFFLDLAFFFQALGWLSELSKSKLSDEGLLLLSDEEELEEESEVDEDWLFLDHRFFFFCFFFFFVTFFLQFRPECEWLLLELDLLTDDSEDSLPPPSFHCLVAVREGGFLP